MAYLHCVLSSCEVVWIDVDICCVSCVFCSGTKLQNCVVLFGLMLMYMCCDVDVSQWFTPVELWCRGESCYVGQCHSTGVDLHYMQLHKSKLQSRLPPTQSLILAKSLLPDLSLHHHSKRK